MRNAFYPGTFDPLTFGHLDIIGRAARLFSKLIIGIAENPFKKPWLTLEERLKLVETSTNNLQNLKIVAYQGLTVQAARENQCEVIIRGFRLSSDFSHEMQLASMNHCLDSDIETIFLKSPDKLAYISSSLVKEIVQLGGDIASFVPKEVKEALIFKLKH